MQVKLLLLLISLLRPTLPLIEVKMEVTAYCGCETCCGKYSDGITASGHKIQHKDKFIAAPRTFEFGTKIYIPGYGTAKVEDRGGAIQRKHLDVYSPSHREALQWGRQNLTVTILGG